MGNPGVISDKASSHPPRWLVAVIVLITAGVTIWAMSMTQLEGPKVAWDDFERNVRGIWAAPQAAAPTTVPNNWARPVAGLTGAPAIAAGATPPHVDRGACTSCHSVMSPRGTPMPSIAATASPPHVYAGPCRNCHVVNPPSARAVAGTPPGGVTPPSPGVPYGSFVAGTQVPSPALAPPPPPPRQPTEAEWMGLEVAPGTTGPGVVVGGAEAVAARVGMMAGDVISSINGAKIATMLDFVNATENGRLPRGTIIVKRGGQRLAFELDNSPPTPPPVTVNPSMPAATNPGWSPQPQAAPYPAPATGNVPGLPPGGNIVGPGMAERRF